MAGYKQKLEADAKRRRSAARKRRMSRKDSKNDRKKAQRVGYGLLHQITARRGYYFYSDYFTIDGGFATILTMFNQDGSDDNLAPMWGLSLIPRGLGQNIDTRLLTQVRVADPKWVEAKQGKTDDLSTAQNLETAKSNRRREHALSQKRNDDLAQIARDLIAGDSYMHVAFKILIKAPTLKELDRAVEKLKRSYDTTFGAVYLSAFEGQQRDDLRNLFAPADQQLGHNYMFTATEFAGSYNIVTHGIEDDSGDYVGQMCADVNNTAVIWDIDHYDSHVIVASKNRSETLSRIDFSGAKSSTLWGVKLAQSAMLNNHRVIHLVLNGSHPQNVGTPLPRITSIVSMDHGDINPFEMFGDPKDELNIFPAQVNKIKLMTEQLSPNVDPITLNALGDELNKFYVGMGLWQENAQEHREKLRIVGIPHHQVPRLRVFVSYLDTAYKGYVSKLKSDPNLIHSLALLRGLYHNMLSQDGDLFDTITSDVIDNARVSPQVIYDFSSLMMRGKGIAMAQFVNALGYAVMSLKKGDVVILHGAEHVDKRIIPYTRSVFDALEQRDVRVAFLYDSIEAMLNNMDLNHLPHADWVLTGYMTPPAIESYQQHLGMAIPSDLANAISEKDDMRYYLRRGLDNVVFRSDLIL